MLLQRARDDDSRADRAGSSRVAQLLTLYAERLRCADLWCLYRVKAGESREPPERSHQPQGVVGDVGQRAGEKRSGALGQEGGEDP